MTTCPLVWVIMGVARSGKTVVGRLVPAKIIDELLNQATWLFPNLENPW